jgi:hypothetical protein
MHSHQTQRSAHRLHEQQLLQIEPFQAYLQLVAASDGIGSAGSGALSITVLDTIESAPLLAAAAVVDKDVVRLQQHTLHTVR